MVVTGGGGAKEYPFTGKLNQTWGVKSLSHAAVRLVNDFTPVE